MGGFCQPNFCKIQKSAKIGISKNTINPFLRSVFEIFRWVQKRNIARHIYDKPTKKCLDWLWLWIVMIFFSKERFWDLSIFVFDFSNFYFLIFRKSGNAEILISMWGTIIKYKKLENKYFLQTMSYGLHSVTENASYNLNRERLLEAHVSMQ